MLYTVSFNIKFAEEYARIPPREQTAIANFISTFEAYGLGDQTRFPGRLSPSWHGLPPNDLNAMYTQEYCLWHYHIGLPEYSGEAIWGRTSDWLLHFQWVQNSSHVNLVDLYQHHRRDGSFYLPPADRLDPTSTFT